MARTGAGFLIYAGSTIFLLGFSSANPTACAIGLVMVLGGQTILLLLDPTDGPDRHQNGVNQVAYSILKSLESVDFFWAVYPDIKEDYLKLKAKIRSGSFPYAPDNPLIVESLRRIGLNLEQISKVTDSIATFDTRLMSKGYKTVFVLPPPI